MTQAALYFPFINVPNSPWFSRTLLYWDSISAIIPRDFVKKPERLQKFTLDLQRAELLHPVIPEQFGREIGRLADGFVEYVKELDPNELARRKESKETLDVHTGKLPKTDFIPFLRDNGLAGSFHYPWLRIEATTAKEYMAYLASCLAQTHELRAVTDDVNNCSSLLSSRDKTDIQVQEIRYELLRAALPAPKRSLTVEAIQIFKKKHGSMLPDFRFWLEERVANIADSATPEMREKRLADTKEQIAHETNKIAVTLKNNGYGELIFGDLCSILGAIPIIKDLPNLVNKIFKATSVPPKSGPLAYAAFARKKLKMPK